MFLEEISIWTCRIKKEDWQSRWASSNPFRVWIEQEDGGRVNLLSLLELGHLSSPAIYYQYSRSSGLQSQTGTFSVSFPGFQPFGLRLNSPPDSLYLHLGDTRLSDFSASMIKSWPLFLSLENLIGYNIVLLPIRHHDVHFIFKTYSPCITKIP